MGKNVTINKSLHTVEYGHSMNKASAGATHECELKDILSLRLRLPEPLALNVTQHFTLMANGTSLFLLKPGQELRIIDIKR